jgi:hypothetical protein
MRAITRRSFGSVVASGKLRRSHVQRRSRPSASLIAAPSLITYNSTRLVRYSIAGTQFSVIRRPQINFLSFSNFLFDQIQNQTVYYHSSSLSMASNKAIPASTADVTVSDLSGNAVALNSLWKDRKILLIFLRHFG